MGDWSTSCRDLREDVLMYGCSLEVTYMPGGNVIAVAKMSGLVVGRGQADYEHKALEIVRDAVFVEMAKRRDRKRGE